VTAAFSDYSQSFTEAIKAVYPQVRFQADHFHTVKNIWGHLKKSLLSYRRNIKADGEANNDAQFMERAKTLWKLRWSLLKKPANLSLEEKQALAALEREDAGFVQSFRHIIRQLVNIFDHTHSEAQARIRLKQLRQDIYQDLHRSAPAKGCALAGGEAVPRATPEESFTPMFVAARCTGVALIVVHRRS
jgi:transposase